MQLLSIKRIAILGLIFSLHIFAIKPLVAGSVDKSGVPMAPDVTIEVTDNSGDENDNSVCGDDTVTLTAMGGTSYEWDTPNMDVTQIITVGAGIYNVIATNAFGCTSASSDITIFSNPLPNANFTFNPQEDILVETEITFEAEDDSNDSYSWDFGSEMNCFTVIDGENTSRVRMQFNCDDDQMISLTVTNDETGCMNTSSQEIEIINEGLDIDIENFPASLCVGIVERPNVDVDDSMIGIKNIIWKIIEGPPNVTIDSVTNNSTDIEPEFQFNTPGEYVLELSATQNIDVNPEMDSDKIEFTVNPNPSKESSLSLSSNDTIICQNEELDININLVDGFFPNYTFRISVDQSGTEREVDILVNNNTSTINSVETGSTGTYAYSILRIEDGNGCIVDDLDQSVSYDVVSVPEIENVMDICISETEFEVSFGINSGEEPFDVFEIMDSETLLLDEDIGREYTSNPLMLIGNGTEWEYFVVDANGCQSASEDGTTTDCSDLCFSLNNIEPTLSVRMLCAGESIKASVNLSDNQLREGQGLRFVLVNETDENTQEIVDTSQLMFDNNDGIFEHVFDNIETGKYFVQVQAGSVDDMDAFTDEVCGIETEDSDVFTVFPFPDIETITTVKTMCANDRETVIDIDLVETLVGSYTMYFSNGDEELIKLINNNTIEIETPEDDILYTIDSLVYENGNFSCTSINADLNVTEFVLDVFPLPVINEISEDDDNDNGQIGVSEPVNFIATVLNSNSITEYIWVFNGEDSISTQNINNIQMVFDSPGPMNVVLTVRDMNRCTSDFRYEFEVVTGEVCRDLIAISLDDDSICFDTTFTIVSNEIMPMPSSQMVNYSWRLNGDLQEGADSNTFEYSPSENPTSGTNFDTISVFYTLANQQDLETCISNEASITIEVNATPEFGGNGFKVSNESPCLNQLSTYILDLEREADEYVWSVQEIDTITDIPIANIGWPTVGTFELGVAAQNENGCNAETTVDIEVGSTEAPPYYELFTIERNDTESIIVAYPDSTFCYEWHSSKTQTDFINNFGNNDITFSNLEEDQRQFKVFNSPSDVSEFTWIKVYGDGNEDCDGSLNDDCATEIFYNGSVPTFFAPRYANPQITNPEIIVYPNPNNGQFIIEFQGEFEKVDYQLSVFDSRGALLLNKTLVDDDISQSKYEVQFNDLVSGLYYIRITSENREGQTKKFVIQK